MEPKLRVRFCLAMWIKRGLIKLNFVAKKRIEIGLSEMIRAMPSWNVPN